MKTPTTIRPSPAMVVAMIALFVAISGTALGLPGKNTVNSGDVKDETLKSRDLKNDAAVQSSDVIDGSLQTEDYGLESVLNSDIATDAVTASKIRAGAVGTPEIATLNVVSAHLATDAVTSAKVAPAAIDESKLGTIQVAQGNVFDFGDQNAENGQWIAGGSSATCPAGTRVISGGVQLINPGVNDEIAISRQVMQGNGWSVTVISDTDNTDFRAEAYCLD